MAEDPAMARDCKELATIGTADRPFRLTDQEQPWHLYDPPSNQVPTRFGDLRALVTQIDAIHRQAGNPNLPRHDTVPGQGPARDAIGYFTRLMIRMPGFEALAACLRRHGRDLTVEATNWVRKSLAEELGGTRDPDGLTLVEIVALLNPLEATAEPPTPKPLPRVRLKKGEAAYLIKACLRSLTARGKWDATDAEIVADLKVVHKRTFYDVCKRDRTVRLALDEYRRRG